MRYREVWRIRFAKLTDHCLEQEIQGAEAGEKTNQSAEILSEWSQSQLLTLLILIISKIELQVRKAGLYLFVSSFTALGGLSACYQNDKLAEKKAQ